MEDEDKTEDEETEEEEAAKEEEEAAAVQAVAASWNDGLCKLNHPEDLLFSPTCAGRYLAVGVLGFIGGGGLAQCGGQYSRC